MRKFLPVTEKEMKERGWEEVDFVYVTGDAYVDHASFGSAIISRLLERYGYKVGMIPQPDWRKKREHSGVWTSTSWLFGKCRKYGLYGKPLYRVKKTQAEGLLLPGRRDGASSGQSRNGLQ